LFNASTYIITFIYLFCIILSNKGVKVNEIYNKHGLNNQSYFLLAKFSYL